jgi:hypothetical protein
VLEPLERTGAVPGDLGDKTLVLQFVSDELSNAGVILDHKRQWRDCAVTLMPQLGTNPSRCQGRALARRGLSSLATRSSG